MIKRTLIVLSVLLSAATLCVRAAEADVAICASGEKTVIAGKSCSSTQSNLFMAVSFPGVNIDTAQATIENFSQIKGTASDAYGNFDLSYVFEGVAPEGVYTVNINDGCNIDGHRYTFKLVSESEIATETANLNSLLADSTKAVADYESFISSKSDVFGITLTGVYVSADKNGCWEYMKSVAPFADNVDAFCAFNRALNITKFAAAPDRKDVLANYMLFADDNTKSVYSRLTDASKGSVCSKLDNVIINTIDDNIRKMMITKLFNQAGRGQIQAVLSEFAAELGMDITSTSAFAAISNPESIYVAMSNKTDYQDHNAVKNHFTELVANPPANIVIQPQGDGGQSGGSQSFGPSAPSIMGPEPLLPDDTVNIDVYAFTDLDSVPWAQEAINALYSMKVVSGVGNNKFNPDGSVMREEFIKMLVLSLGYTVTDGVTEFADVDSTQWYAPYIKCAVENGIVNGVGDGRFGVGTQITRQDMAVMLDRVINNNLNIEDKETVYFSDNAEFADYAKAAVESVSSKGIMTGTSADTFAPRLNVTRAMAAVVIFRII